MEYFEKKTLVSLGYKFESNDLMDFEVRIFNEIDRAIAEGLKK